MKRLVVIAVAVALLIAAGYAAWALLINKKNNVRTVAGKMDKAGMLPRVLFLTTGTTEGNGEITEGVSIAIQELTRKGAFVWLGTRNYLLQPNKLNEFNVIIAPTSFDYHDGDRKYSLTFMSDAEMKNLIEWVREGGVLITEENIGRNTLDDVDRLSMGGEMNESNWPLAQLFGISMREIDMMGFIMEDKGSGIWAGMIKDTVEEDEWAIVPTLVTSPSVKVLAEWRKGEEVYPAIIENSFGKGKAFLLTSTYMLHPANDGGVSSIEQIEKFYDKAVKSLPGQTDSEIALSPWPDGHSSAACITFNSSDDPAKYRLILEFIESENLSAAFVIDSAVSSEVIELLNDSDKNELISGLGSRRDFTGSSYWDNAKAFIELEQSTGLKFQGVRFPFKSSNYAGLTYAGENGYIYDTSVGIDHLSGYAGCTFPYNIPLARDSFFKSTDMLELCQILGNDFDYFQRPDSLGDYTEDTQRENATLFSKYLLDFYEYVAKRNDGMMVFSGNPDYIGISELTIQALKNLTDELKRNNAWITTPAKIAEYRNSFKNLFVQSSGDGNKTVLRFSCPEGMLIEGISFKLGKRPSKVSASCNYKITETPGRYYIIADVRNGDEIAISN